jgi:serine/threonine protein kinase
MSEENPAQLFDVGRVLSDDGPHGLVIRAAVSDEMYERVAAPSVAVKIMSIGDENAGVLCHKVEKLIHIALHASLVKYHGAWLVPGGDVWIVSDLCESGSVADIIHASKVRDPLVLEGIASYVMRNVLLAVDFLHSTDVCHGDLRAKNFLVDGRGHVKIGDYGVYDVLETVMKPRTCYPGARLWPAPELATGMKYDSIAEVWALGIALLEIVEGRQSVQVSSRLPTGMNGAPRFNDISPWSAHLREFVKLACTVDRRTRATIDTLLQSEFIQLGSRSALEAAVDASSMIPTPVDLQSLYDPADAVWTLRRQNCFVRAPLIDLDDFSAEDFTRMDRHVQDDESMPAVELSLRMALENMRIHTDFDICAVQTRDRLRAFVETIDVARRS